MTNQAKDDELNGITSTEEYDKWVNKLPKDRLFTIKEVGGIVAVANFWKLQEQAKDIKKELEEQEDYSSKTYQENLMIGDKWWDKFWEKYGVKEEGK